MSNAERNKVYAMTGMVGIAPGVNYTNDFFINNYNRRFRVKSINWSEQMRIPSANGAGKLNKCIQDIITSYLIIGQLGAPKTKIAECFLDYSAVPVNNGNAIIMYEPDSILFDSFFVNERLPLEINVTNDDLLRTINYYYCVVVEVENY